MPQVCIKIVEITSIKSSCLPLEFIVSILF